MTALLTSSGLGAHARVLRDLAPGPRAGIVLNSLDAERRGRRGARRAAAAELSTAGLDSRELDLRDFFGGSDVGRALDALDVVWVVGGNTFVLARAMTRSGFAAAVRERVAAGALVYAGFSAGACTAGPDLRGIELMDDPGQLAKGDTPATATDTLRLVPFRIVPHWQSGHELSPAADRVVATFEKDGLDYRTLRDGEGLVVSQDGSATSA